MARATPLMVSAVIASMAASSRQVRRRLFFYYRARPPTFPPLRPNPAFRRGAWAELRCPVTPLARVPPVSLYGPRPASASRGAPRSSYVVAPPTGGLRESGSALRARVFVGYREAQGAAQIRARTVLTSGRRYAA